MNPLTGLLAKRTGELVGNADLETAVEIVVHECIVIANAYGIAVDETEVLQEIETVARATRDNKSSMLQDLERGRRTEIDAINGAIVKCARECGIPAPVNSLLTALIRARQTAR